MTITAYLTNKGNEIFNGTVTIVVIGNKEVWRNSSSCSVKPGEKNVTREEIHVSKEWRKGEYLVCVFVHDTDVRLVAEDVRSVKIVADVSVTISTDKKIYHPCENMTITVVLTNNDNETFNGTVLIEIWDHKKPVWRNFSSCSVKPGESKTLKETIHVSKEWRKGVHLVCVFVMCDTEVEETAACSVKIR